MISIIPYGDQAILLNFEQKIDPKINNQVIILYNSIKSNLKNKITFCSPAYCSITIGYNPAIITYEALKEKITLLFNRHNTIQTSTRVLNIPVCYEVPFAMDFGEIERITKLSTAEFISIHTATSYTVYMIGFLPGFAYMGILPEALFCHRKGTPRIRVPERSVGIAGLQTGIYPFQVPGGWQIIGSTPIDIFNKDKKEPCLFQVGDTIHYHQITTKEYQLMRKDIEEKHFKIESIYG